MICGNLRLITNTALRRECLDELNIVCNRGEAEYVIAFCLSPFWTYQFPSLSY